MDDDRRRVLTGAAGSLALALSGCTVQVDDDGGSDATPANGAVSTSDTDDTDTGGTNTVPDTDGGDENSGRGGSDSDVDGDSDSESGSDSSLYETLDYDLSVAGSGATRAFYEIRVDGRFAYGDDADPQDDDSDPTRPDQIRGDDHDRLTGTVGGGEDSYTFDGELTKIAPTGPVKVTVDGDVVKDTTGDSSGDDGGSNSDDTNVDANIVGFDPSGGTFQPGDTQTADVRVKNTGNTEHTFYVGYSVKDSNGEGRHNGDGPPGVTLRPDETGSVTVAWRVTDAAPEGTYGAVTTVRKDWDGEDFGKTLNKAKKSSVFEVAEKSGGWGGVGSTGMTITSHSWNYTYDQVSFEITSVAGVSIDDV